MNRKPIFDAAKRRGAQFKTRADVDDMDAAINEAFAAEAPTVAASAPEPSGLIGLQDPAAFFDHLRKGKLLGPDLSAGEVSGVSAISEACAKAGWPIAWASYALGTAYLETAHSMQPVKEANWLSEDAAHRYFMRMYDITGQRPDKAKELGNLAPGDGARYPGAGYPQMTGKKNYARANEALPLYGITGVDLIAHPELAMRADVAAAVMVDGMEKGWFTGKKLADYLPRKGPATASQFTPARRIINALDRALDVAAYALEFQNGLTLGKWGPL